MPDFMMNYGASGTASEYLQQMTTAVRNQVDTVHATVQTVISELEGAMAQQYKIEHDKWTAKVDEMGGVLSSGNTVLVNNTQGYYTTDVNEQNRWEGLAGA
ncbi:WXG100 family type VII secretion target [Streptomyces sp. NPDC059894]|uniref:WXG100 family type VII secretion target n=1 Tax=unclassified Streptomyces TaxID=2593676 RepID=UPI00365EA21C